MGWPTPTGGSGTGTYRQDNLQITAVPEPATLVLLGLHYMPALLPKCMKVKLIGRQLLD